MKEFNYEAAKNGAPVQTRDGRKARIICWDKKGYGPIVALIQNHEGEFENDYDDNGKCKDGIRGLDLVMAPTKHEGWVNVYKNSLSPYQHFVESTIYKSEEEGKNVGTNDLDYIATVKIEWEE